MRYQYSNDLPFLQESVRQLLRYMIDITATASYRYIVVLFKLGSWLSLNVYPFELVMRVTIPATKPIDLSVAEYANNPSPSKCYKDKFKTVLYSAIYLRNYQMENNNINQVPAMFIARWENQILLYCH